MSMMTCTCTCTYDDMHMHMHMTCACTCTCHGSKRSRPTPTKLLSAQRLSPSSSLTPPHNHPLPKPHTHTPRSLYARCESSPRYRIRYPLLLRQKNIGYCQEGREKAGGSRSGRRRPAHCRRDGAVSRASFSRGPFDVSRSYGCSTRKSEREPYDPPVSGIR